MTEIKISELSIGDWVRVINQFDAQIDGYHSESGSLSLKTRQGHLVHYRLEDIQPIPLTPEILEKNGFVKGEIYEGISSIVFTNSNIIISWFKNAMWNRLRIYNALGDIELCSAKVRNVHQLQHALRLAGVEKEIEV